MRILLCRYHYVIAEQNAHDAKWLRLIARGMRPGQQIGDVYSDEQLSDLRTSIKPKLRRVA